MAENDKEDFWFVQIFTNNAGMLVGGGIWYTIILCLNWCQVNIAVHSAFAVAANTPGVDLPVNIENGEFALSFFFQISKPRTHAALVCVSGSMSI